MNVVRAILASGAAVLWLRRRAAAEHAFGRPE
jgi:hypothetical protein